MLMFSHSVNTTRTHTDTIPEKLNQKKLNPRNDRATLAKPAWDAHHSISTLADLNALNLIYFAPAIHESNNLALNRSLK